MSKHSIIVRGARVNNSEKKKLSFSVPIERLTVVTGVSGSGKSSLAFDTITPESAALPVDRCRLTRGSFSNGWISQTWTSALHPRPGQSPSAK